MYVLFNKLRSLLQTVSPLKRALTLVGVVLFVLFFHESSSSAGVMSYFPLTVFSRSSNCHTDPQRFFSTMQSGSMSQVKAYLKADGVIDCVNEKGQTGLHLALANGRMNEARELIDFASKNPRRFPWFAQDSNKDDILSLIFDRLYRETQAFIRNPNRTPEENARLELIEDKSKILVTKILTALTSEPSLKKSVARLVSRIRPGYASYAILCVHIGWEQLFDLLLRSGIDLNIADSDGNNALITAIVLENLDSNKDTGIKLSQNIIRFLKTKSASYSKKIINQYNSNGNNSLSSAFSSGDVDRAEDLLALGANFNRINIKGKTVLMKALTLAGKDPRPWSEEEATQKARALSLAQTILNRLTETNNIDQLNRISNKDESAWMLALAHGFDKEEQILRQYLTPAVWRAAIAAAADLNQTAFAKILDLAEKGLLPTGGKSLSQILQPLAPDDDLLFSEIEAKEFDQVKRLLAHGVHLWPTPNKPNELIRLLDAGQSDLAETLVDLHEKSSGFTPQQLGDLLGPALESMVYYGNQRLLEKALSIPNIIYSDNDILSARKMAQQDRDDLLILLIQAQKRILESKRSKGLAFISACVPQLAPVSTVVEDFRHVPGLVPHRDRTALKNAIELKKTRWIADRTPLDTQMTSTGALYYKTQSPVLERTGSLHEVWQGPGDEPILWGPQAHYHAAPVKGPYEGAVQYCAGRNSDKQIEQDVLYSLRAGKRPEQGIYLCTQEDYTVLLDSKGTDIVSPDFKDPGAFYWIGTEKNETEAYALMQQEQGRPLKIMILGKTHEGHYRCCSRPWRVKRAQIRF